VVLRYSRQARSPSSGHRYRQGLISLHPAGSPVKYPTADNGKEYDPRTTSVCLVTGARRQQQNCRRSPLTSSLNSSPRTRHFRDPQKISSISSCLGRQRGQFHDLTSAYQTLANGGRFVEPTPNREPQATACVCKIPPQRQPVQAGPWRLPGHRHYQRQRRPRRWRKQLTSSERPAAAKPALRPTSG
jgi:hypothetical protein